MENLNQYYHEFKKSIMITSIINNIVIWAKRGLEIWIDRGQDKDKINVSSPLWQKVRETIIKYKGGIKLAQKPSQDVLMRCSSNSTRLTLIRNTEED